MLEEKVISYMNDVLRQNNITALEPAEPYDAGSGSFEYYQGQATNNLGQKLIVEVGVAGLDLIKQYAQAQKLIPDIPRLLKYDYHVYFCDEHETPLVQLMIMGGKINDILFQSNVLANQFRYKLNSTYKWAFKRLVKVFAEGLHNEQEDKF